MKPKKKKSSSQNYIVTGIVLFIFLSLAGGIIYLVSSDRGGGKKVFIAKVDLVRPNTLPDKPPPPPKEKPPEPEMQKKETIIAPQDMSPQASAKGDDKPVAEGPLGLEGAQGGAGSDGFGLAARKGGRDVTTLGTGPRVGGGKDMATLLRQYAPYTRLVEEDVNRIVRKRLEDKGGIPKGKLEALAEIILGNKGEITDARIIRSSGNNTMDEVVKIRSSMHGSVNPFRKVAPEP